MTKGCVLPYYIKGGKPYGLFGLRSDNNLYDVFGGAADRLESVESTASRELLEETSKALYISPRTLNKSDKLRPVEYATVFLVELSEQEAMRVISVHNNNLPSFRLRKQIEFTEMLSIGSVELHNTKEDMTEFSKLTIQAYLDYKKM